MYFVYRNNLQMYLTKENIVIKTWNRNYQIKENKKLFEMMKRITSVTKSPKTIDEIYAEINGERKDIDSSISVLIKCGVILTSDRKENLENPFVLKYDNALTIQEQLRTKTVCVKNIPENIVNSLHEKGVQTSDQTGDYLLIWNKGNINSIANSLYDSSYEKIVICGEEQDKCYLIAEDSDTNDIRKAKYIIRKDTMKGIINDNQKIIFRSLIVNKCFQFFFANMKDSNVTVLNSDMSVKQEKVNMCRLYDNSVSILIDENALEEDTKEVLYPDFDEFVNTLPFIGYFGSMNCDQFPIPQQEVILLDENGEVDEKISCKGDCCEKAMLGSFLKVINRLSNENSEYFIGDSKQIYYFNMIANTLFCLDVDCVERMLDVVLNGVEICCNRHRDTGIYQLTLQCNNQSKMIFFYENERMKFELVYGLIDLGFSVKESIEMSNQLEQKISILPNELTHKMMNIKMLEIFKCKNIILYEKCHAYSEQLRNLGIYLGKVEMNKENING